MSKHWDPRIIEGAGRRTRPRAWTSSRSRRVRSRAFSWSEIRLTLLAGVGLGLLYVGIGRAPDSETASPWAPPAGEAVRVAGPVDVVDGDTFYHGGQKIRIADIDTPEVAGRCESERMLAARATQRLEQLLAAGPFELRSIDRDEDRYGRKLRVVTRNGRSIGDQLVSEGLARTWSGRREPWC